MAKFSEETLTSWTWPPSDSEETKLQNAERMITEAISNDQKLSKKSTETFGQGSYANDTNVRLNSDIDINVRYKGGFYFHLPDGKTREDFDLNTPTEYSFEEFKTDVENALVNKFGRAEVKRFDKCITVIANSYRAETDVVPTWNFRRYNQNGSYVLGAKFKSDAGKWIVNYPKQHLANAKQKNAETQKRYKRLTRIHRRLRYKMIADGVKVKDSITSFLIECLTWNVPNETFNNNHTWSDRLKASILFLYNNTKTDQTCSEWGEVSELLYLFRGDRKWNRQDVNDYLVQAWNYLEY